MSKFQITPVSLSCTSLWCSLSSVSPCCYEYTYRCVTTLQWLFRLLFFVTHSWYIFSPIAQPPIPEANENRTVGNVCTTWRYLFVVFLVHPNYRLGQGMDADDHYCVLINREQLLVFFRIPKYFFHESIIRCNSNFHAGVEAKVVMNIEVTSLSTCCLRSLLVYGELRCR